MKTVWRAINSARVAPYVFTTPFIITFCVFFLYPTLSTVQMSFQRIIPGSAEFIGFENYQELMSPSFYRAVSNTLTFTFWSVLALVVIPILLAALLNYSITRLRNVLKAAIFVPAVVSTIVGGVIFRQIFGQLDTSFMNAILAHFSIPPQEWTMKASTGMLLMVLLAMWRWMGVNTLYFLAGLQNIPGELYESADIDGANWRRKFLHITLPSLQPVIAFVLIISVSAGLKMFEESYVFWQGKSPRNIGLTIVGYIYREGIAMGNMGLGSAAGIVLLMMILMLSVVQMRRFGLVGKGGRGQ